MVEQIQEVFWLTSADRQQLLYISPAFEKIWGRSLESLYTYPGGYLKLFVDSMHPTDRDDAVGAIANPLQLRGECKAEYRIVRPDGSIRWVRSRSFFIQNEVGETWGIASFSEDITLAKHAEETLRQQEQTFGVLVENTFDIIARFDRELHHVYVNPAVELATGMPPQEFFGKTHRELGMPEPVVSLWEESIQKVFQTVQDNEFEFSFLTPNGLKYYQSRLLPELAIDGSVESVIGITRDITKNQQMEESLQESENRFGTVFEYAPIGMAIVNTQGVLLQTNPAFQKIFGYTEEELQNRSYIQLTHPDTQAESLKLFQELLGGQRNHFGLDNRCLRKDGCWVWVHVSIAAVRDANGLTQYLVGMIQDISDTYRQVAQRKQTELERQKAHDQLENLVTERTAELINANTLLKQEIAECQRAQEALTAQKDFLQTVLDANPNLIYVKDLNGNVVLANQAGADFYGITVEDLLSKSLAELHPHSDELERYIAQDQEVLATSGENFILEQTFSIPNGKICWYQTIKKPLFSRDGQVCQVLDVSTDITERKLAQEALRESEQRYRLLIERMNEGVVINDQNCSILYVNEKLSQMLGYSPSEMVGHHLSEFLDEANLKIVQDQTARQRTDKNGCYELIFRKKDGHFLCTIISSTAIQKQDSSIEESFGVVTDITAFKAVEQQLQEAKEQLRAVLDAVPGSVSWINAEGQYLGVNQHLADSLNLSPDTFIGKELGFMKNSSEFVDFMTQFLAVPAQTDRQVIKAQVNGSTRFYLIAAQKYNQGANAVSVGIDISDRKQAEKALTESHQFLQTILDTNPNLIFVKDKEGKIVLANQACADVYGTTVADLLGLMSTDLHSQSTEVERFLAQDQEVFATREQKIIPEEAWYTATGEVRWFQTIKKPLFDREGQVHHILVVSTDITQRKQAEVVIQESLQEKEVLLQEIHHRVKNNLQVISSLLDLQSQHIEPQTTIEVFRESCNRVKSMALVHEKLYESKDFAKINFAEYVENLTSYLFQVYAVKAENISIVIDIDQVTLNIDIAIPCGLIISELVSNALKYAFPDNQIGVIHVILRFGDDKCFTLTVKDNGVGFPIDLNLKTIKSLGLQLVKVLTNQLEGTLELDCSIGTEFRLTF